MVQLEVTRIIERSFTTTALAAVLVQKMGIHICTGHLLPYWFEDDDFGSEVRCGCFGVIRANRRDIHLDYVIWEQMTV